MSLDIMTELEKAGAVLLNRHFVYKSGKHGNGYINMDPLFPDIPLMQRICAELITPFGAPEIRPPDTVAAPATGGVVLAALCAYSYDKGWGSSARKAVWADKNGSDFAFERAGFVNHIRGKRVLVVEDLLTTGGSVAKVVHEVELHGGEVIGVSAIVNRGGVTAEDLGVPRLETLASVSFEAIDADQCPLCEQGVPIVEDIGHGDKYKLAHPNYKGGYIKLLAA